MAYDIQRLKNPKVSNVDSRNYDRLVCNDKMSFNMHNRIDKRETDYIFNKKYSKERELKATYHGAVCDKMLRVGRRLTQIEKESLYKDCKKLIY